MLNYISKWVLFENYYKTNDMKISKIVLFAGAFATALSAQALEKLPYYNPCEDLSTITWVRDQPPYNTTDWTVQAYGTGTQANPAFSYVPGYRPSAVYNVGSTVFTKELDIKDGSVYKLTFVYGSWYTAATMSNYVKFNVALYREAKYEYKDDPNLFTEVFVKEKGATFTATSRPSYTCYFKGDSQRRYVGFGNRGGGNVTRVGIDDILIVEVDAQTPDVITNLSGTISGKSVTMKFTLPTRTVVGDPLTKIGKVKILRGGVVVKEFADQAPGASITYTDNVTTSGDYLYTIVCSNNGSDSEATALSASVTPGANLLDPSRAQEYGVDETKVNGQYGYNYKALAVYAPGEGVKVRYAYPLTSYFTSQIPEGEDYTTATITRQNDGTVLVENCCDGEYLDSGIDMGVRNSWQYKVNLTRYTNNFTAYSSILSLNNPLPFMPGKSAKGLGEFTLYDVDGDNTSWSFMSNTSNAHYHDGLIEYYTCGHNVQGRNNGDDWMITPGLLVEQGKTYRIDITAFVNEIIETPTQMMIAAGQSNTPEAMTDTIIEPTKFKHMGARTYSAYYNPEFSGNAFFGIRSFGSAGSLGVSDIQIYEVSSLLPEAVDIIHVAYKEKAGNATISFNAPSKTIGGAALASLDKIELYCNNNLVQTFAGPAPGALLSKDITFAVGSQDIYTTVPYTAAGAGLPTSANVMVLEPPYQTSFDAEADFTGYTVIDPQESGYTWSYMPLQKAVRSYPDRETGQNDYLITPPVHLEKDMFYRLDFTTWLDTDDTYEYYNNQLEVLLGTAPVADSLTTTILEPFYVRGGFNNKASAKEWFTVPVTGEYYLAWHTISEPYLGRELYLDDISISDKIPGTYPGTVDDLKILPEPEGGLSARIEFKIPANDLLGNALSGNVHNTVLYRDGQEIKSWANQTPGTPVSYDDNDISEGAHLYTITCFGYNNDTKTAVPTRDLDKKVFVGLNAPAWVSFIKVVENPEKYGEVTITWGAPESDKDGFPLNTSKIYYNVGRLSYNPVTGSSSEQAYVTDGLFADGLTYTVDTKTPSQQFMKFYVDAATKPHDSTVHSGVCSGGLGEYYENVTPFMSIGKPYSLPFTDSFTNSNSQHPMMGQELFGIAMWGFNTDNKHTGVKPVDGDKGIALMEAAVANGSSARLYSGRIALDKDNPTLSMYVYNMSEGQYRDSNELIIAVGETSDVFVPVTGKTVDEWCDGVPGWNKITVDLSEYAGKVIYLAFEGVAHRFYAYPYEEELISFVHIDKVVVDSPADVDAALKKVENADVYVGTEHAVSVTVKNNGGKPLSNATVTLMLDGAEIDSKAVAAVEPGQLAMVTFMSTIGRDNLGTHKYSAKIVADGDVDNLDNAAEGDAFTVNENNYPKVQNLTGRQQDSAVTLEWNAPAVPEYAQEITDDFEGYESWSTMYSGIGNYGLVDADGLSVGGFEAGAIPIEYRSKQSFTLWDFSYTDEDGYLFFGDDARYTANSGNKCLVSMFGGLTSYTDDRLISPLLSGNAQTISFYAKALAHAYPENFQVYYSTTGTEFADFQPNYFKQEKATGDWTKYTYNLPEGARYFMIRHYSMGGYFFFLDDLSYTPAGNETLNLTGYNVYRDGKKLNPAPIAEKTWTDNSPVNNADNTYGVTAVYDRGESPMEETVVSFAGVASVEGSAVRVAFDNGEIVITGAAGLNFRVADTSGAVIAAGIAAADTRVAVAPGIYLVTVEGSTVKVMVK